MAKYGDTHRKDVPLIVGYGKATRAVKRSIAASDSQVTQELTSVRGAAVRIR